MGCELNRASSAFGRLRGGPQPWRDQRLVGRPSAADQYWCDGLRDGTQDPIRVAEEPAIIDHLARGRYFVGFARGYQSRWTNVLGQFTNTTATLSDGSADDEHNREVFEERVGMVLKCWQQ